jgi:hypothetical protein
LFYKTGEQVLSRELVLSVGGGERVHKGECVHANGKMRPVVTIPGMGGVGIKKNNGRG